MDKRKAKNTDKMLTEYFSFVIDIEKKDWLKSINSDTLIIGSCMHGLGTRIHKPVIQVENDGLFGELSEDFLNSISHKKIKTILVKDDGDAILTVMPGLRFDCRVVITQYNMTVRH